MMVFLKKYVSIPLQKGGCTLSYPIPSSNLVRQTEATTSDFFIQ
jgi:hypothetical protein